VTYPVISQNLNVGNRLSGFPETYLKNHNKPFRWIAFARPVVSPCRCSSEKYPGENKTAARIAFF
jgi:hypothetical protein